MPVSEEDFEGIGTRGAYNPRNKHIHINQLLGDTQKLDTLLHEMSHHFMGHSPNIEKPTMQREFEADGLSIMFGKRSELSPVTPEKATLQPATKSCLRHSRK
ncbi:MAG: ImmA/IrrE family metallo-endopeptidase [Hominenteromicrobium sp.]|uniref:ImmA/IrrE family metallo-endopeptidase n=1 Tax=Hominenteromicrobium sp. TaxID=3073581 RepID=UPI0039912D43